MSVPLPFPARKRTRLKDYDYSQSGHYFITICTNEREELFWDDKNEINDAGTMAYKWLFELENKFGLSASANAPADVAYYKIYH